MIWHERRRGRMFSDGLTIIISYPISRISPLRCLPNGNSQNHLHVSPSLWPARPPRENLLEKPSFPLQSHVVGIIFFPFQFQDIAFSASMVRSSVKQTDKPDRLGKQLSLQPKSSSSFVRTTSQKENAHACRRAMVISGSFDVLKIIIVTTLSAVALR